MSDLVSRQYLLDEYDRQHQGPPGGARKIIEEAPAAIKPNRWIPVTERLPDDDTEVIVSCTDDSGDSEFSYTTTGWHFKGMWIVNNERCFFVRAWQPLPEKPYREE